MFECSASGMLFIGLDGRILHANAAFSTLLGYELPELLAGSLQALADPDDAAIDVNDLADMLHDQKQTYQAEKRFRREDGQAMCGLVHISLVRDDHGRPLHFVAQVQDPTQAGRAAGSCFHPARP